jgi:hypothetical protein
MALTLKFQKNQVELEVIGYLILLKIGAMKIVKRRRKVSTPRFSNLSFKMTMFKEELVEMIMK